MLITKELVLLNFDQMELNQPKLMACELGRDVKRDGRIQIEKDEIKLELD